MYQQIEDTTQYPEHHTLEPVGEPPLWERILDLVERDVAERRARRLFVEVRDESGSSRKEIGELSAAERRGLPPDLAWRVAERLLDRYLAEQGRVDLVEKRRTYTKKVRDLTPEDLPALVEADRWRAEEERELAEFVRAALANLKRLPVAEGAKGDRPPAACVAGLTSQRP